MPLIDGKPFTRFTNVQVTGELRANVSSLGWAQYTDTQYTEGSPLVVSQGVTATLPNNAGESITDYLPSDVDGYYDGSAVRSVKVGETFSVSVRFKVKSSTANGAIAVGLDIGGTQGVIVEDTRRLVRGASTENILQIDFTTFALDTFLANGATVKFTSISGDSSVYDINYVIVRITSPAEAV